MKFQTTQYPYKYIVGESAKIIISKRLDYDPITREQIEVVCPRKL